MGDVVRLPARVPANRRRSARRSGSLYPPQAISTPMPWLGIGTIGVAAYSARTTCKGFAAYLTRQIVESLYRAGAPSTLQCPPHRCLADTPP